MEAGDAAIGMSDSGVAPDHDPREDSTRRGHVYCDN